LVFLFLNNSSNNQENNYSFEEKELIVSMPQELEIMAYRESSFDFSIKNEKENDLDNLNITLEGAPGKINPNNINIKSNESKNFKLTFDSLKPGEYDVFLKIQADPDTYVNKSVSLKSKIVVGLDGYHVYNYPYGTFGNCWKGNFESERLAESFVENEPTGLFSINISNNCRGSSCVGRYSYFSKSLEASGMKTKIIESPFFSKMYNDFNIFVILPHVFSKNRFSFTEKNELKKFLDKGGSLLIIEPGYYYPCHMTNNHKYLFDFLNIDLELMIHRPCIEYSKEKPSDIDSILEYASLKLEHPITVSVERFPYAGFFTIKSETPLNSLLELEGRKTIYAIQNYSNGKIGIISSTMQLEMRNHDIYSLHESLIRWLVLPEECEEMG
jgi:plastocyanin